MNCPQWQLNNPEMNPHAIELHVDNPRIYIFNEQNSQNVNFSLL